jgi:hypothetical protein
MFNLKISRARRKHAARLDVLLLTAFYKLWLIDPSLLLRSYMRGTLACPLQTQTREILHGFDAENWILPEKIIIIPWLKIEPSTLKWRWMMMLVESPRRHSFHDLSSFRLGQQNKIRKRPVPDTSTEKWPLTNHAPRAATTKRVGPERRDEGFQKFSRDLTQKETLVVSSISKYQVCFFIIWHAYFLS